MKCMEQSASGGVGCAGGPGRMEVTALALIPGEGRVSAGFLTKPHVRFPGSEPHVTGQNQSVDLPPQL